MEKLRVRGNPRKGIISVRILRPPSEIRKYETKQNHVRKLRNDSSKWYDWNLKGIRILAFSVRNLRKYEAYLALCLFTCDYNPALYSLWLSFQNTVELQWLEHLWDHEN